MIRLGVNSDRTAGNDASGARKAWNNEPGSGRLAPISEDECSTLVERDKDRDRVLAIAVEKQMLLAMGYDTGIDDMGGREARVDCLSWFDFQDVREGIENVVMPIREAEKLLDQRFELLPRAAKKTSPAEKNGWRRSRNPSLPGPRGGFMGRSGIEPRISWA
jgi:hypothetical protein